MKRAVLVMGRSQMLQESKSILPFADYQVLATAENGMDGLRIATRYEPDLIILGWNLPGLQSADLADTLVVKHLCAVMILLLPEEHEFLEQAVQAGTHSVLLYPFQAADLVAGILQAEYHYQRELKFRAQVQRLEEELKARKLIYQATVQLIETQGYSEEQAYTVLRQQAMKTRKSIGAIALAVTRGTWTPP